MIGLLRRAWYSLPLLAAALAAAPPATGEPAIAIIIDDMGYRLADGLRALALPAPLGYSFLPHTPHAPRLAEAARADGKEVLVHLPMEAVRDNRLLGPGALMRGMSRETFVATLRESLRAVPHAVGVNNHMGSRLTRDALPMRWLMESLREQGLYFVDSRTTARTVAARVAREESVPALSRDVFLDNVQDTAYIRGQLALLVATAMRRGHALGIAHPQPATLAVLEQELTRLGALGVRVVPPSALLSPPVGLEGRAVRIPVPLRH